MSRSTKSLPVVGTPRRRHSRRRASARLRLAGLGHRQQRVQHEWRPWATLADSIMANSAAAGSVTASREEPPRSRTAGPTTMASITHDGTSDLGPELVVQPNDGFDWGDAAVGGADRLGLAGAGMFTGASARRPRMQPSA